MRLVLGVLVGAAGLAGFVVVGYEIWLNRRRREIERILYHTVSL